MSQDNHWMQQALQLAERARAANEVPVGALIVLNDQVVGEGYNQPISQQDPTAHAEIIALRHAATALNNYRLLDTTLYVTIEPCMMCVGAMIHARVKRIVFGALEPKAGAIESRMTLLNQSFLNHQITHTSGVLAHECGLIMSNFFKEKRK